MAVRGKHTSGVPEWPHFHLLPFFCWQTTDLLVICMAKGNKCSMFFKAVETGPHCGGEIGKCSLSSE